MIHSIGMCELSVADSVRPRLKKELFFLSLSLSTAIVGVIGPVIVPSPPQIIATFPTTTVTDYTALVGYQSSPASLGYRLGRIG
jgi:hypothetical protein